MNEAADFWLPALTDAALRAHFEPQILQRGQQLQTAGAVLSCETALQGALQELRAEVQGGQRYQVALQLSPGSRLRGRCDCPYAQEGLACKHQAALALAWRRELGNGEVLVSPAPRATVGTRGDPPPEPELLAFLRRCPAEELAKRLFDAAALDRALLRTLRQWQNWQAPIDSPAAARRRIDSLLSACHGIPSASLQQTLIGLLQAWRSEQAAWAQAGAEQALLALCARLDLQEAEPQRPGQGSWRQLAQRVSAELMAAWAAQGEQPPSYAERYLQLLAADGQGLLDPAQVLPLLGPALTERAGHLLCREWEAGAPPDAYLEHLQASADSGERLRVLRQSLRSAADHARYVEALLAAGRQREALAAAEQAHKAHPQDGALEGLLIQLYEDDGWDAEALALRRAAFRREPTTTAYLVLLQRLPEAEARGLEAELAEHPQALQIWADCGRWQQALDWTGRQALEHWPPARLTALADWAMQLPASRDAEAAALLQRLLSAALPRARAPYERERAWLHAVLQRLDAQAGRLWLAWLRVEWRRRPAWLALLPN
ncbi:MAG: SWIM zinc finger domain-containing protein [Inhella sp.]